MILHNDKDNFELLINATSEFYNVSKAIIEKDYYITLLLKELATRIPHLIFKGGTSLSKCFKIIDRFSEDIDITLAKENCTASYKKRLKKTIIEVCDELNLKILNKDETRSRRSYNCYKVDYKAKYGYEGINNLLLVETVFIVKSFPVVIKNATSMIYDYLKDNDRLDIVKHYLLEPFTINVQTLDRTLIDKVYAICDYMLKNKIDKHSRHIYDLSRLISFVKLDENLKELINLVREDRKKDLKCFSAQDYVNINFLLNQVIYTKCYENDYINNTEKLLSKKVTYDEAIKTIQYIIDSKIFE